MKVRELIAILEDLDPEANVLVMMQQSWPFECAITGVTTRAEIVGADEDDEADEEVQAEDGTALSDVFIVEGQQLRYGSKDAWDVAHRG